MRAKGTYTRGGAGLKLDFDHMHFPFSIGGGFVSENTQVGQLYRIHHNQGWGGRQYRTSKAFNWMAGFEHWDANGSDYFDMGTIRGPAWAYEKFLVDNYVAGFDLTVSKSTDCFVSYSFQDIDFPDYVLSNFQNQEYQAKVRLRF